MSIGDRIVLGLFVILITIGAAPILFSWMNGRVARRDAADDSMQHSHGDWPFMGGRL